MASCCSKTNKETPFSLWYSILLIKCNFLYLSNILFPLSLFNLHSPQNIKTITYGQTSVHVHLASDFAKT